MLAHLMSAQGPLARSVGDVRAALEVMSQRDPRDPWWVPAPLVGPKPKGPIKVALAKLPDDMDVAPSVRDALRQAADHLERSGYRVSEIDVPDINGVWQTWCDIIANETAMLQEAAMLKVTSPDFHAAWSGIKAKATRSICWAGCAPRRRATPISGPGSCSSRISLSCLRRRR
jgi:amidase